MLRWDFEASNSHGIGSKEHLLGSTLVEENDISFENNNKNREDKL